MNKPLNPEQPVKVNFRNHNDGGKALLLRALQLSSV